MQNYIFLSLLLLSLISFSSNAQTSGTLPDSGKASFYQESFDGLETSSGEEFDKDDFTAAHRSLPFNTIVCVTNLRNGKNAIVRINDRGPFNKRRIIDVSPSAAKKLNMVEAGIISIRLQTLTLFDKLPFSDSTFVKNQVWDCFGRLRELENTTVYIWETAFFKHAFYMATAFVLDYHVDSIVIRVVGKPNHRIYQLLATGLTTIEATFLMNRLGKDGFANARIIKPKKR